MFSQRPRPPPRFFNFGTEMLPPNVEEIRDIVFGTGEGRPLRLNIARPKPLPKEPMPIIVFIHGGAWISGDYRGPQNYPLAAQGYFTVNIEYRLSSEAIFPAQIKDCKAAIRWLRANAEEYNINPERIGVWGTSAGGHLAALLGTSGDTPELEGKGGSPSFSSRVQAVTDLFGPTDFNKMSSHEKPWREEPNSPECRLVGGPLHERADLVKMANPITYITPDDPPFLIIHGEKDQVVPFNQSELLYGALMEAGVEATLIKVENGDHGFRPNPPGAIVKPNLQEIMQIMMGFFDRHLKK